MSARAVAEHCEELLRDCNARDPYDVALFLECAATLMEAIVTELSPIALEAGLQVLEEDGDPEFAREREAFVAWVRTLNPPPKPVRLNPN